MEPNYTNMKMEENQKMLNQTFQEILDPNAELIEGDRSKVDTTSKLVDKSMFVKPEEKKQSSGSSGKNSCQNPVTKTVVINNSSGSSSSAGKLFITDNYVEPIFRIEKVPSNKTSSNENSRGSDPIN